MTCTPQALCPLAAAVPPGVQERRADHRHQCKRLASLYIFDFPATFIRCWSDGFTLARAG